MSLDDPRHPQPDGTGAGAHTSRDELASALVDGMLTADEAAAARRRPDVMARAAEMQVARQVLRAVPAPDAAARERAIAAALAAFDAAAGATDDVAPPTATRATGTPATPRRAAHGGSAAATDLDARRARHRGVPRWLGAAAAAAVVVGAAGLAIATSGDSDDESADTAATAIEDAPATAADGGGGSDAAEAPAAAAETNESEAVPVPEVGDLGTFATADALAERVGSLVRTRADEAQSEAVSPDTAAASERASPTELLSDLPAACAATVPAPLDDPSVRLHGRAVVDGEQVDLWVLGGGNDDDAVDRLVAIDATCDVVVDRPLG